MRFILLSLFSFFFLVDAFAQQLPLFTQYRDNWTQLNPATLYNGYINYEHTISFGVSHRQQWVDADLQGAPVTSLAQFQIVSEDYNFHVGGYLMNDQTGDIGTTGVYGNFAYQLPLGRGRVDQTLSIGLNGGLVQYRVDIPEGLRTNNGVGNAFSETILYPDFGAGIFYHYDERFYAGVSIPQLFGLDLNFRDEDDPNNSFDLTKVRHYYALIGAYIDFDFFEGESSFLEPSLWIRYVENVPISFDFNLRYKPSDYFWIGAGIGSATTYSYLREKEPKIVDPLKKVLHLEAGILLPELFQQEGNLKIGFGYDVQLSQYLVNFGNSLELHVIYSWER